MLDGPLSCCNPVGCTVSTFATVSWLVEIGAAGVDTGGQSLGPSLSGRGGEFTVKAFRANMVSGVDVLVLTSEDFREELGISTLAVYKPGAKP